MLSLGVGMPMPLQEMILGESGDRGKGNFQPIPWVFGSGIENKNIGIVSYP